MKTLRIRNWAGAALAARLSAAAAGALLVCAAVSCKKDGGSEPAQAYGVRAFQATSEGHSGDGKTTLTGNIVKWEKGDAVAVQGSEDAAPVMFTTEDSGVVSANFECGEGQAVNGESFYAIYPYSAAKGGVDKSANTWSVTLPQYQVTDKTWTFASGANLMAARSNDEGIFTFRNMCGVLRLRLKGGDGMSVRFIRVESRDSDEKLWGTGQVVFGGVGGSHSLAAPTDGDGSVYLVYPHGVGIGGEYAEFDIVLPAGSLKKGFKAEVHCKNGDAKGVFTMTAGNATGAEAMIQRNQITVMEERAFTFAETAEEDGALPGVFTVNASGKKVRFSKGNLQCHKVDKNAAWATNNIEWRFAENQWDMVEGRLYTTAAADYADRDVIGLFGWGTSGHDYRQDKPAEPEDPGAGKVDYTYHYEPWKTTTDNALYGPTPTDLNGPNLRVDTKSDWGYNKIANGGNEFGQWRTLMSSEMSYIMFSRNTTSVRFTHTVKYPVVIDGHSYQGQFVYPDGYSGGVVGQAGGPATLNEIDAFGIMFLPFSGYRYDHNIYVGGNSAYWYAEGCGNIQAYRLNTDYNGYSFFTDYRSVACAVRLARDME